jgi:hypothetical protein
MDDHSPVGLVRKPMVQTNIDPFAPTVKPLVAEGVG